MTSSQRKGPAFDKIDTEMQVNRSEKNHKSVAKINPGNESEDELNMLNDKLGFSEIDVGEAAGYES